MAKIYIEPPKAKATLQQLTELERVLKSLSQETGSVRSNLRYKIAGREALSARMQEAMAQITRESESARNMRTGLEQVVARYEQAEKGNNEWGGGTKTNIQSGGGGAGTGTQTGPGGNKPGLNDWIKELTDLIKRIPWIIGGVTLPMPYPPMFPYSLLKDIFRPFGKTETELKGGGNVDVLDMFKDRGPMKKLDQFKKDHTKKLDDTKFYYDPKTGQKIPVDPNDEKAMEEFSKHNKGIPVDVTLLGVGSSSTDSIFSVDGGFDGKYGGMEGEAHVLKLDKVSEAHVGLGYAGASLGTSFTAFSATERAYLGSKDYNVYEEVTVEAGRVGVNGDVRIGIVDKEGKINPSLYGGVKAEAIAGEISGKVGTKIGGVDVSATGTLNYGLGAHANVGLHDGKFSVDLGLTVGVGASVKFDVDVGGLVNTACEKAGKLWSGVKSLFS